MKKLIVLVVSVLLFFGCAKNDDGVKINPDDLIIGVWVGSQYNDSAYTITRSNEFVDDKDGFQFNGDGTFMQRINSGWCATPPISYANYTGNWTQFPDNTYFIETEFWGGITSFRFEVISIEEDEMVYKIIYD